MREPGDLGQHEGVGFSWNSEFEQADDLAALGHGRESGPLIGRGPSSRPPVGCEHLHCLGTDRLLGRSTVERQNGRVLLSIPPLARLERLAAANDPIHLIKRDVRKSHERPP